MALSLFSGGRCNSLWDPFEVVHFPLAHSLSRGAGAIAGAKIDWVETEEAHVFKADLPGLKKEGIKVELEDGRVLQISGERSQEEEKKGNSWHQVERSYGKFLRRFKLPENAQAEAISAKVENGVLTVTVPKAQSKAPEKRSVAVA
ncbi:unnamed protein product [Calypogeia fissa]